MNAPLRAVLATFVLCAATAVPATAHGPCNHYASIVIENDTDIHINYAFKWGNGSSCDYCLDPGYYRVHYYEYDYPNQNRSPVPAIRFDYDLTSCIDYKKYSLTAYAAPNLEHCEGYRYWFGKSRCGCWLELYNAE
jgi:hypothetical protein